MNSFGETVRFFLLILTELTALFLGISTLVGLVFEFISDDVLKRWLSRNGLLGNFLGATLGALTPFCSCSTIPLTVGLLRAGVPFGATMSFVLASPLLNPIIISMFWVLLGWKVSLVYFVVTFAAAMTGGVVLERLGLAEDIKNVRITGGGQGKEGLPTFGKKLKRAFLGAWSDFIGVLPYLLIGVTIGAAIYGYMPADLVARIAGPQNPLAIPLAAIIGVPLYLKAETIIPVAVALTRKGMGIGAVISLVVGGAGMSIPEMSMLAGIFKKRLVAIFIAVVFLTAVIAGFVFTII